VTASGATTSGSTVLTRGVLVMTRHAVNERGYRYPQLRAGCTGCRACSQICPDFVFQVYKYDTPLELPVDVAAIDVASEVINP
jgi:formate hydrogenlyase subunit 6/NADH:ubiquinone oxidoreductase subunit I